MLEPMGMPFVNADLLAKRLFPDDPEGRSYEAALLATEMREELLVKGQSFCFETVFSHPSKIDFLAKAKAFGYQTILVFIHVDSLSLNKARISQRVAEGGHNVPDDKVEGRIPRTLENVRTAIPLCDQVRILDNSRCDDPFKQVATIRDQHLQKHQNPLPAWASDLLSDFK